MSRLGQKITDAPSSVAALTALLDTIYTRTVPGEVKDFATPFVPKGWLAANGQTVARVGTYANLHQALAIFITGNLTNGSNVITNVNIDLSTFGLIGYPIENSLIPAGATVTAVTATTITFTPGVASAGAANQQVRIYPHGNGDGVNTFNLPNYQGGFRRAWNPTSSGVDTNRAWASIQTDTYKNHSHNINDPTHAHSVYDPSHAHGTQDYRTGAGSVSFGGGGGNMGDSSGTNSAGTGIGIYGASTGISVLTSTTGGTETRPRNHAVLTCIAY